jgi:hypothetical protein
MPNLPYSSVASQAFGGVVLTINSTTFVARNWEPARSSREKRRDDENGDEAAFMLRVEPTSQSGLVLQMANSSVVPPFMGNVFSGPSHSNVNVNYVVTKVNPARPQGEFWITTIDYKAVALPTD